MTAAKRPTSIHRLSHAKASAFGQPYGGVSHTKAGTPVRMYRGKGNRTRWYSMTSGRPIGPVQANVAPAMAYAIAHGWRV